jgi:hypothetical protein
MLGILVISPEKEAEMKRKKAYADANPIDAETVRLALASKESFKDHIRSEDFCVLIPNDFVCVYTTQHDWSEHVWKLSVVYREGHVMPPPVCVAEIAIAYGLTELTHENCKMKWLDEPIHRVTLCGVVGVK